MAAIDASPDFAQIDREIANLNAQIAHYRHHRTLLTSTLLSRLSPSHANAHPKLRTRVEKQRRLVQESAYRLGAGITSFHVRDPDPNAVDEGRVLGIKIEVFNPREACFDKPYYVFLNRPDGEKGGMRVHRHTVPPFVGLKGIVGRWLPYAGEDVAQKQDVVRFARAVRKELVAGMKRKCAIEALGDKAVEVGGLDSVIAKDVEAREFGITWTDASTGRVKLGKDGEIEGVYVAAPDGSRLRQREKALRGGNGRIEGIVQRLTAMQADEELLGF